MPTTNELRLALRDADDSLTPHYRDNTRQSARTLAAAVRELYEIGTVCQSLMDDAENGSKEWVYITRGLNRYRAALEEDEDA